MAKRKALEIEACLTCPLCCKLLEDATTITLCLHTFCRRCINEKLLDEKSGSCPVCNIDLGSFPLKILRTHEANLRRCGWGGCSKYKTKEPDWHDDYEAATKWKRELQANEAKKQQWAAKTKEKDSVSAKTKTPADDEAQSSSESSPK